MCSAPNTTIAETKPQLQSASKSGSLGKDANIVATSRKQAKYQRFSNLSFAQHLLIENDVKSQRSGNPHRTRFCHAVRAGNAETISVHVDSNPNKQNSKLSGVQTCGSVWACPVCSKRIAIQRGKEIGFTIDKMIETGHIPLMMTNTASHKIDTHLPTFVDKFGEAWRMFTQHRQWRKLKKALGIKHSIKAIECTHSNNNGFHHHQHGILFAHADAVNQFTDGQAMDWIEQVTELWLHCLRANGLSGNAEHALDVQMSGDVKKDYLAKLGMSDDDTTNLDYELTAYSTKDYKGRNIWSILNSARVGNEQSRKLYIQYVEAYDGKNWITYSRGLKDLVGLEDMPDESVAEDESLDVCDYIPLIEISDADYAPVRHFRAYGELLEISATTRDAKLVQDWLRELREEYNSTEAGLVRERMLAQFTALDNKLKQYRLAYNKMKNQPAIANWYHSDVEKWKSLKRRLKIQ